MSFAVIPLNEFSKNHEESILKGFLPIYFFKFFNFRISSTSLFTQQILTEFAMETHSVIPVLGRLRRDYCCYSDDRLSYMSSHTVSKPNQTKHNDLYFLQPKIIETKTKQIALLQAKKPKPNRHTNRNTSSLCNRDTLASSLFSPSLH